MTVKMNNELTQERLKELLSYDEKTGHFVWLIDTHKSKKGDRAGHINDGYVKMYIDGLPQQAHRLVWLYVYGYFPENFVDHKKGIRHDNRLSQLRLVTSQCNQQSCKIHKHNTSGYPAVSWNKARNKYYAYIMFNDKIVS